jgi:mannitol-specific phosphotransferase system IIBC component
MEVNSQLHATAEVLLGNGLQYPMHLRQGVSQRTIEDKNSFFYLESNPGHSVGSLFSKILYLIKIRQADSVLMKSSMESYL